MGSFGIPAGWFELDEDWKSAQSQKTRLNHIGALGRQMPGHPAFLLVIVHDDHVEDPRDFMRLTTDLREEYVDRAQKAGLQSFEGPERVMLDARPAWWVRYFTCQVRDGEPVRIGNEEVKLVLGGRLLEVSLLAKYEHLPICHPDFQALLATTKWTV